MLSDKYLILLMYSHQVKMIKRTFSQLYDTATMESDGRLTVYVSCVVTTVILIFIDSSRNGVEVAIVYYRSAYLPHFFPTEKEWDIYLLLEQSRAIKCPSVAYHLAGMKKIQQVLYNPTILER